MTSKAVVAASNQKIANVTGKMNFLGIHRYEIKQISAVALARAKAGVPTLIVSLILGT